MPLHLHLATGRPRVFIAVALVAAGGLVACSAPAQTPAQRPASPSTESRLARLAPTPPTTAPRPGETDPTRVDAQADALDLLLDSAIARCMTDRGFTQLATAYSSRRAAPAPEAARAIDQVHPLEMGPLTAKDAERFGMLGTDMAFRAAPRPFVESTDPGYEKALTACTAALPGGNLQQRLADWREYASLARDEILAASDDAVRRLALARLECVRNSTYPAVRPADFLEGDMSTALERINVRVGSWDEAPADPPPLAPHRTRVVPAAPRLAYHPTAGEVAFAKAYAACGTEQGFAARLHESVAPAASSFRTAHAAELAAFSATFTTAIDTLRTAQPAS